MKTYSTMQVIREIQKVKYDLKFTSLGKIAMSGQARGEVGLLI